MYGSEELQGLRSVSAPIFVLTKPRRSVTGCSPLAPLARQGMQQRWKAAAIVCGGLGIALIFELHGSCIHVPIGARQWSQFGVHAPHLLAVGACRFEKGDRSGTHPSQELGFKFKLLPAGEILLCLSLLLPKRAA